MENEHEISLCFASDKHQFGYYLVQARGRLIHDCSDELIFDHVIQSNGHMMFPLGNVCGLFSPHKAIEKKIEYLDETLDELLKRDVGIVATKPIRGNDKFQCIGFVTSYEIEPVNNG